MKFRRPAQDPLELNLTPLIDCLLFLIVFFMLSTTFSKSGKLQIQLPKADAAIAAGKSRALEVSVDVNGQYAVDGKLVTGKDEAALREAIVAVTGDKRDRPFIISADGKAPHQAVVTVMDVAGQLGFRNLGIGTRDAPAAKPQ